jgi:hypothetical protein
VTWTGDVDRDMGLAARQGAGGSAGENNVDGNNMEFRE